MSNALLFIVITLIWGTTWLAITYQLGEVSPVLSVAYRFTLAAALLGAYCWWRGLPLKQSPNMHIKTASIGLSLFCLDYAFLYASQQYLLSAVVAVMSSSIIYLNVFMRRAFLGKAMRREVLVGAGLGMLGILLILYPEFQQVEVNQLLWWGVVLASCSFISSAVGNVLSEHILDKGAPVVQLNFWAMSYSLVFLYGFAWLRGDAFTLPAWENQAYYWSILYLAIFGSVLAFGAYMRLVKHVGSDKAAYVVLTYPLVALAVSTVFEGYQWSRYAAFGVALVLVGNAIAMNKLKLPVRANRQGAQ